MIICVCKAVSDKTIRRSVEQGEVMSLRDLTRDTGLGTCCGKCVPAARSTLAQALSRLPASSPMHGDLAMPMAAQMSC
ncbi:(2Fe-2S)-binding protein [Nevskia sp.]|uniref:(2Fe-2S)-binding protein n=1 Tax=Nevskia sp. TaxID=1929292 RepID=UPI0025F27ACE|nr:(2Fe-2S)-binding protein [Nevskia sp.]